MDPPLINESSFSAAYSLAEIWPFSGVPGSGALGLRIGNLGGFVEGRDGSLEESSVTDQSGAMKRKDESSEMVSSANDLNNSTGKRAKQGGLKEEKSGLKAEAELTSGLGSKTTEQGIKPSESAKQDYIHVRARRGQATDSHSLAERARREKISERMKVLQDLVPGCNKVIGKALVLDEIINYVQSLQCQVEFLSMKLEAVNSKIPSREAFPSKDVRATPFDATGMMLASQAAREYLQGSHPEWLHMQIGSGFERTT